MQTVWRFVIWFEKIKGKIPYSFISRKMLTNQLKNNHLEAQDSLIA